MEEAAHFIHVEDSFLKVLKKTNWALIENVQQCLVIQRWLSQGPAFKGLSVKCDNWTSRRREVGGKGAIYGKYFGQMVKAMQRASCFPRHNKQKSRLENKRCFYLKAYRRTSELQSFVRYCEDTWYWEILPEIWTSLLFLLFRYHNPQSSPWPTLT